MIISAAGNNHLIIIWLMLQFASAGVIAHAGIKVPFFTFFGHDSGLRAKEPPLNMMIAMGITAFLCVFIGIFPQPLYNILPYPVDYIPYTGAHVVGQLQLLMFGIFAFYLLLKSGYYPSELRAINLDTDWFYRKGTSLVVRASTAVSLGIANAMEKIVIVWIPKKAAELSRAPLTRLHSYLGGKKGDSEKDFHDTATLTPSGASVFVAIILIAVLGAFFMCVG